MRGGYDPQEDLGFWGAMAMGLSPVLTGAMFLVLVTRLSGEARQ